MATVTGSDQGRAALPKAAGATLRAQRRTRASVPGRRLFFLSPPHNSGAADQAL